MLLPQSSAFAALKNRLNSVSAIGYLHIAPRAYVPFLFHFFQKITEAHLGSNPVTPMTPGFDRPNRLKAREESGIKWGELLEKFKSVQEKARRASRVHTQDDDGSGSNEQTWTIKDKALPDVPKQNIRPLSAGNVGQRPPPSVPLHKPKSSLGNFGRLTSGVAGRRLKK